MPYIYYYYIIHTYTHRADIQPETNRHTHIREWSNTIFIIHYYKYKSTFKTKSYDHDKNKYNIIILSLKGKKRNAYLWIFLSKVKIGKKKLKETSWRNNLNENYFRVITRANR